MYIVLYEKMYNDNKYLLSLYKKIFVFIIQENVYHVILDDVYHVIRDGV